MFNCKSAAILGLLLMLGGCDQTRGGVGRLHKGSTVAYTMNDFNDYVLDIHRDTNAPHWTGIQQADAQIEKMRADRKIFTLVNNVKAEYIQSDDAFIYVRILEGEHRGEEVWTGDDAEFILKNQHQQTQ